MGKTVRLGYIDTAKGVLILLLLLAHAKGTLYNPSLLNIPNAPAAVILSPLADFAASFFMAAFFVITGLCSSFKGSFKDFLFKNIRQLIIPTITLSFVSLLIKPMFFGDLMPIDFWFKVKELLMGGPWFICALMLCKLLLWCLIRLGGKKTLIGASLLCFAFGATLHLVNFTSNIFWLRHDFLMLPFLTLGYLLKGYDYSETKCIIGSLALYIPTLVILSISFDKLPHLSLALCIPNWWSAILVFISSASGSLALLGIFRRLSLEIPLLKIMGRTTLTIYLLHLVMLIGLMDAFRPMLVVDNYFVAVYAIISVVSIIVLSCSLIEYILNQGPLKLLMGKPLHMSKH